MSKKESRLEIRVDKEEKQHVKKQADKLGLSVSDYIRFVLAKRRIITKTDVEMVVQLRKTGVNINQIAYALNANPLRKLNGDDLKTLEELSNQIDRLIEKIQS